MILVTGQITEITVAGPSRTARIKVGGAYTRASLDLVADAIVGDTILVEGGVAIGKIETSHEKERLNVSGNSR